MKYVSPQTEKRKKQQQKWRRLIMIIGTVVIVAAVIAVTAVSLLKNDGPSSSQIAPGTTESESVRDSGGSENISSGTIDENDVSSQQAESRPEEKPAKKKQSIVQRIKAKFAKTVPMEYVFPAMAFGRQIEEAADEIISLSPLATEIILSSPSQNALVAVSEYCNKRGNELMTVGTPLIPKTDKIIQLAPDYLIVQNPLSQQDKIRIEQSGITVLEVKSPDSFEELGELYRSVTALTHGADIAGFESQRVIADLQEKLSLYDTALSNVDKKTALMLFNGYGMVATQDTFEAKLLSTFFDVEISGNNYFTDGLENVIQSDPQVLIVSDIMTAEQLAGLGFAETYAMKNGNVYYVSIQDFENISPKCIKSLSGIANSVYGNAIQPAPKNTEE